MSFASHLQCTACGRQFPAFSVMNLCPEDGRPVSLVMALSGLAEQYPDQGWYQPERRDMWRFGGLLALDINDATDANCIVSLGEGATPLRDYAHHPVASDFGFQLSVKDEGRAQPGFGANPTQSFKDRGMAMTVSMARKLGISRLVIPTQGNAGDSLAEYALAAGLEAVVIMPEDTPMPILGRVAALARQHASLTLETCRGTIREAGELMREKYLPAGWFNVATFQEPGWRIEGKKTLGLEIAEALPGQRWELPDVIVYPTGGGTGILGMWKAFAELEALGLTGSARPRIVAVQSEVTAPLVRAFESGASDTRAVAAGATLATGLNVPGGVGHARVLEIIRASGGVAISVKEAAIAAEFSRAWRDTGWWFCPEGAATLAALRSLAGSGVIARGDRVVAVNTGSFEKYLPQLRHLL